MHVPIGNLSLRGQRMCAPGFHTVGIRQGRANQPVTFLRDYEGRKEVGVMRWGEEEGGRLKKGENSNEDE